MKTTIVAWAFNLNSGFIIISANDAVFPVIAYSFETGFTGTDFPEAFDFWMEKYKMQIKIASDENLKPREDLLKRYGNDTQVQIFFRRKSWRRLIH